MSNFRPINRDTGFLLPPSVDEWLPQRHLARFVVEVIDGLDLSELVKAYRGSGSASYHPAMLLGLMVYGYATKVFSSRAIERATYDSVAVETTHWCQRIRFPHKYLSLKTKWVTSILSLLTRFRSENPISDLPAGKVTTIGIPSLPRMLLDSESPLSLPLAVLPSMLPWFLHFMRACATTAAYASAASLAPLLAQAGAAWQRRWAVLPCEALVRREGCLYLYRNAPSPDQFDFRLRMKHRVRQELLSPGDVARLEPALAPFERHGVFFPDAMHIDSPAMLMRRMAAEVERRGGAHRRAHAVQLKSDGVDVVIGLQAKQVVQSVRARQVVISAGAHSLELARQAGESVPLDTERGYHVEYAVDAPPIRRPVCPVERGIYATPLTGRLRVAGTVEFGGLARPANPKRWSLIDRGARELFPSLSCPTAQWLGFRPSMPDSVPVIGRARGIPGVELAFAHGHLGLTLAAITAELVARDLAGKADPGALAPYAPRRWSR